jgi:hypothetical protein
MNAEAVQRVPHPPGGFGERAVRSTPRHDIPSMKSQGSTLIAGLGVLSLVIGVKA